ncbi:MAG: hypothetical protein WBM90_05445 [Acidimicrobiia bacterium]
MNQRVLLIAVVILTGLTACNGEAGSDANSSPTSVVTTTTTEAPVVVPSSTPSTAVATTSTTQSGETPIEIMIVGGEPEGGAKDIRVDLGSKVHIVVSADSEEHVHVHGYDLFFDVTPAEPADIEFVADVPGVFEIEVEDTHSLIAELEVS